VAVYFASGSGAIGGRPLCCRCLTAPRRVQNPRRDRPNYGTLRNG